MASKYKKAIKAIKYLGYEIIKDTPQEIRFMFKGNIIIFYVRKQWATGKGIKDGRGLKHLLKQIQPHPKPKPRRVSEEDKELLVKSDLYILYAARGQYKRAKYLITRIEILARVMEALKRLIELGGDKFQKKELLKRLKLTQSKRESLIDQLFEKSGIAPQEDPKSQLRKLKNELLLHLRNNRMYNNR